MDDKCPTCGSDDYAEEVCPYCVLAEMHKTGLLPFRGESVSLFVLREAVASVRLSRADKGGGNGARN